MQRTRTAETYEGLPVVLQELSPPPSPVGVVLLRARGRADARLEAVSAQLRRHSVSLPSPGNTSPNAGFIPAV